MKCGQFDRVAEFCSCAVSFDVRDRFGMDARLINDLLNDLSLSFDARRIKSDLIRSVVIDADSAQQRINMVAVLNDMVKYCLLLV